MSFNFKEIIIVEQLADGYNTTSAYKLKTAYTNHVEQIEAFNIPNEKIEEHLLNGVSQYTTTNRHGEKVVYTLIRSTNLIINILIEKTNMIDAKTATPEQVSQLIAEMKEAKNKAFMLQNQVDDILIHSKNTGLSIFHDEEDQELYFLNCFEGNSKGISMISTDATAVREFMACKGVKEYQKLVKKHTVKVD